MASLDISFCTNRSCPRSDRCGRSVKRLDGKYAIVSMMSFKPEDDGTCKHEEPYTEYEIPQWMKNLCRDYEAERARKQELKNANSLDAD